MLYCGFSHSKERADLDSRCTGWGQKARAVAEFGHSEQISVDL